MIPQVATLAVKRGVGEASVNIHPHLAVEKIVEEVQNALQDDASKCRLKLPKQFTIEITYRDHPVARRASFFPGASLKPPSTIEFESDDYFEVLRLLSFVL